MGVVYIRNEHAKIALALNFLPTRINTTKTIEKPQPNQRNQPNQTKPKAKTIPTNQNQNRDNRPFPAPPNEKTAGAKSPSGSDPILKPFQTAAASGHT
jgi:hypothetical protein